MKFDPGEKGGKKKIESPPRFRCERKKENFYFSETTTRQEGERSPVCKNLEGALHRVGKDGKGGRRRPIKETIMYGVKEKRSGLKSHGFSVLKRRGGNAPHHLKRARGAGGWRETEP